MRSVDRDVPSNQEDVMGTTVIGVDPHKRVPHRGHAGAEVR
jgi:hypothetical protein